MTHIIIENGYDNVLPNIIKKLLTIPNVLTKLNSNKKNSIFYLVFSYVFIAYLFIQHISLLLFLLIIQ